MFSSAGRLTFAMFAQHRVVDPAPGRDICKLWDFPQRLIYNLVAPQDLARPPPLLRIGPPQRGNQSVIIPVTVVVHSLRIALMMSAQCFGG